MASAAVLRVKEVVPTHRKMGFFRVRLSPVVEVRSAELQILRPDLASNIWTQVSEKLQSLGGGVPIEVRGFTLRIGEEPAPRLEARLARLEKADKPFLTLESVRLALGNTVVRAGRAQFPLDSSSPIVNWTVKDGIAAYDFLSLSCSTNSTPKTP